MADLTFVEKNNQKKTGSVFASSVIATSATMADTLFTLPRASLVTGVNIITTTPSGVASSNVTVKVGTTNIATNAGIAANGVSGTTIKGYFPTGGAVTVVAGGTAPDAAGRIKVVVEYIETTLTNGQYTD
jgi:hypothetical protein